MEHVRYIDTQNLRNQQLLRIQNPKKDVMKIVNAINGTGQTILDTILFEPIETTHLCDPKIDNRGNTTTQATTFHNCMFITAKRSFIATEEEIQEAEAIHENQELEWNEFDYLKKYPKLFGKRFVGMYEMVDELMSTYKSCFATHTFSRQPYARLRYQTRTQKQNNVQIAIPY